jgi:hypothetical protein
MNISAPFIRRPVGTTLLTAGVLLTGGHRLQCPARFSAAAGRFPTISVSASLPGGSPEIMASSIATPLERQFGHIAGVTEMTSSKFARQHQHHSPIRSEPQHRRRGARRGGGHQRGPHLPARKPARQSNVSQGQSRRLADS